MQRQYSTINHPILMTGGIHHRSLRKTLEHKVLQADNLEQMYRLVDCVQELPGFSMI